MAFPQDTVLFLIVSSAPEIPAVLPRGPHGLAREVVAASQRGRLLTGITEAVAEKGYGAVSVADVIARAGVSRKTFYVHFRDKLECFLAAYDFGVGVLLDTVRAAGTGETDVLALVRARIRAYLAALAAEPAFARTFLIEVRAAGPEALERQRAVHEQFAALGHEFAREMGVPESSHDLHLAVVGATNELVTAWVHDGRAAELPALEDTLLHIQVALLGGQAT